MWCKFSVFNVRTRGGILGVWCREDLLISCSTLPGLGSVSRKTIANSRTITPPIPALVRTKETWVTASLWRPFALLYWILTAKSFHGLPINYDCTAAAVLAFANTAAVLRYSQICIGIREHKLHMTQLVPILVHINRVV